MCKLITFMLTEAPRLRSAAAVAVLPRAAARWSGVLPETSIWSTSSPSRVISSHSHPEIPSCNVEHRKYTSTATKDTRCVTPFRCKINVPSVFINGINLLGLIAFRVQ